MRLYKRLYMTKFWDPMHSRYTSGVLRTQVSRAYSTVESYIGSLYARTPL
jgi:hypothetical protein